MNGWGNYYEYNDPTLTVLKISSLSQAWVFVTDVKVQRVSTNQQLNSVTSTICHNAKESRQKWLDSCSTETQTERDTIALILLLSVRNMVSLSTPRPQPPVGGSPYSSAVQKFSSTNIASSSPAALSWQCTIHTHTGYCSRFVLTMHNTHTHTGYCSHFVLTMHNTHTHTGYCSHFVLTMHNTHTHTRDIAAALSWQCTIHMHMAYCSHFVLTMHNTHTGYCSRFVLTMHNTHTHTRHIAATLSWQCTIHTHTHTRHIAATLSWQCTTHTHGILQYETESTFFRQSYPGIILWLSVSFAIVNLTYLYLVSTL